MSITTIDVLIFNVTIVFDQISSYYKSRLFTIIIFYHTPIRCISTHVEINNGQLVDNEYIIMLYCEF